MSESKDILKAYEQLNKLGKFRHRKEQVELSCNIAEAFGKRVPYCAEAPTGTGKTIAYLIGALQAQRGSGKKIVISTATVGLQEQIVQHDLPALVVKAGLISESGYAVAKGRGRYFCPKMADRLIESHGELLQQDMFADEADESPFANMVPEASKLLELFNSQEWMGDVDSLPGGVPKSWGHVSASSETCLGSKCEHYSECPFYQDRNKLIEADIIVANHDLVLLDMELLANDREPILKTNGYYLVVDEAHHLMEKAVARSRAEVELTTLLGLLSQTADLGFRAFKLSRVVKALSSKSIGDSDFDAGTAKSFVLRLRTKCLDLEPDPETHNYRFKQGEIPLEFEDLVKKCFDHTTSIVEKMTVLVQELRKQPEKVSREVLLENALLFDCLQVLSRLSRWVKGFEAFLNKRCKAKWVHIWNPLDESKGTRVLLCASPLDGAEYLEKVLWKNDKVSPVFLSATLKGLGDFEPFRSSTGAPKTIMTEIFPYVLPYENSSLSIPLMEHSPKEKKYSAELANALCTEAHIDPTEGTLILFNSRYMAKEVTKVLKEKYGEIVVAQEDWASMKKLMAIHKNRLDEGKGSILVGLQKLAEGVDLPGKYCSHVIITRLPFPTPVDPVELEREELMGKEYFEKHALPFALLRLIQMVGRLVRTDADKGRITVFDKRLVGTNYGQRMMDALPPFRRIKSLPVQKVDKIENI